MCGREQVSEKLTGRTYSEETLNKMRKKANERPYRGGKPRRLFVFLQIKHIVIGDMMFLKLGKMNVLLQVLKR